VSESASGHLFALADLHLPGGQGKPMEVFGRHWDEHLRRVEDNWRQRVRPEDSVLLVGDLSWAMSLQAAMPDLTAIGALPGQKYLVRGNHDYWWRSSGNSVAEALPPSMAVIDHRHAARITIGGQVVGVAGTRGWLTPPFPNGNTSGNGGDLTWDEHDRVYRREVGRLESSLGSLGGPVDLLVVALHFPPFSSLLGRTAFTDVMEQHDTRICVYGHLHGLAARRRLEGVVHRIEYYCVACDVVDFGPVRIL